MPVMLCSALVGQHVSHLDWLSPPPSLGAPLAHFLLLLLQDVLGVPSISAGAWYAAINLQLFALSVLRARLARRAGTAPRLPVLLVLLIAMTALSLLLFSREPKREVWAISCFGAYGLGRAGLDGRAAGGRVGAAVQSLIDQRGGLVDLVRLRLAAPAIE